MRAVRVLPLALVLALAPACAHAQRPSILQVPDSAVRVRLASPRGRPVADAPVEIYSDNGIRCIRAPCPTNGTEWRGRSDAVGIVVIPTRVLQASTTITTPGYQGDLVQGARHQRDGTWRMKLSPAGGGAPE